MKPGMQLFLAGAGGLAAGAILMGFAARQQQQQLAAQQAAVAAVPTPTPVPQLVSSTQSLSNGWMYFVTIAVPGGDLTQAATQATAAAALVAAGFVDPTTKSTPTITPLASPAPGAGTTTTATQYGQAVTVYNGVTGTAVPASTATLVYASVLGYPTPEGLTTV